MTVLVFSSMILGLSAGFSPGPLTTIIISETVRHGRRAGFLVALAPLLSDAPIVFLSLLVSGSFSRFSVFIVIISLIGAAYLVFLGYRSITAPGINPEASASGARGSLVRGFFVNIASPNPWLFWMTVGSPQVIRFYEEGIGFAAAFVAVFYLVLIASKLLMAWLVSLARERIIARYYRGVMVLLGFLLWGFAFWLARDGLIRGGFL